MLVELAEFEVARIDWRRIRASTKPATDAPKFFSSFVSASTDEDVSRHGSSLWECIGPQGILVEGAFHLAVPLSLAFADPSLPLPVRKELFEMVYWTARGEASIEEDERSGADFGARCTQQVMQFRWLFVSCLENTLGSDSPELRMLGTEILELIELLDADRSRTAFLRTFAKS